MKFPSLFTRIPSYQRFSYKPRYYDPEKEERLERETRIRRELERERGEVVSPEGEYRARIKGSFQRARKRSKTPAETNAIMLRLVVLLFITIFLFAFLTWGSTVIYGLLVFIPVYAYFKFFKKNS